MKKYFELILFAVIILFTLILSFLGVIEKALGLIIVLVLMILFNLFGVMIAKKEKVSIIFYIMLVFTIICVILLILNIVSYVKIKKVKEFNFQITAEKEVSPKAKLFSYDNNDYFTYNMKNVKILINNKEYELQTAFEENKITLNKLKESMISDKKESTYIIFRDGGSEKIENSSYSMVLCQNNNKDIVFVPFDFKYDEKVCS